MTVLLHDQFTHPHIHIYIAKGTFRRFNKGFEVEDEKKSEHVLLHGGVTVEGNGVYQDSCIVFDVKII